MRAFPFRVGCDVCGGPGVGSGSTAAAMYDPRVTVAHSDPRVCRAYLDEQRRLAEKAAKEAAMYPPINWKAQV